MRHLKPAKIASDLSKKAFKDTSRYDPIELGLELTKDLYEQLMICASAHDKIFKDIPQYCIGLYIAGDPLLKNLQRRKYTAFPWLPEPRPQQSVFLYTKATQKLKRLWSLPDPATMAVISEMTYVDPKWQETKAWCDAFYEKNFFETIRGRNGLSMLSQQEWLDAYGPEIGDSFTDDSKGSVTDTFDFSKIAVKKVVHDNESIPD